MQKLTFFLLLALSHASLAIDEMTLFSKDGNPIAYINFSDEVTIYLWSGEPVAYLSEDTTGGHHVYDFDGKHLGWFVSGFISDNEGNAACATRGVLISTNHEPYKDYKKEKPYRAAQDPAPYKPYFSTDFGPLSCGRFFSSDGES